MLSNEVYEIPGVAMPPEHSTSGPPAHQPVMVREVLEVLSPQPGELALDLTVGMGGHALAIGKELGTDGLLVGIDADRDALQAAKATLTEALDCSVRLFHGRFSEAPRLARKLGIRQFDLVLADLGVGSHQLDEAQRGFSFDSDAPLDMRYDTRHGPTAREVINRTPKSRLADIFYELGEERYSRQIAAEICRRRREQPIETPAELAEICKKVYARRGTDRTWRIHPATRVMMALRIYVNRELEELGALLGELPELLAEGGRVAVLTYHSLEARKVKQAWRQQGKRGRMEERDDSPLMPTAEEVEENPRARSAQLRAARRPGSGPGEDPCTQ
jgi:16S rRNA (cytosine1402-N4)-methyltransferase